MHSPAATNPRTDTISVIVSNISPAGRKKLASEWRDRRKEKHVANAIEILREKFASVESFGPQQLIEFHNSSNPEEQAMQARRAYELVREFLETDRLNCLATLYASLFV